MSAETLLTPEPRNRHEAASRRTSRFEALDGLRAVGALMVLTTHVGFTSSAALVGPAAGFLARMDSGVALFFVVSGFLLYRPHVQRRLGLGPATPVGRYLKHRALRILPALWIAVLVSALFVPHSKAVPAMDYVRHALLMQVYGTPVSVAGLTQMWSLATEFAFYLALPLLAAALLLLPARRPEQWLRRTIVVLAATPVLGASWMAWNIAVDGDRGLWLPGYLGWFCAGMALAAWHSGRQAGLLRAGFLDDVAAAPLTVWACALAAYAVVTTPVAGPYSLDVSTPGQGAFKSLSYCVIAVLLVLPAVAPEGPAPLTRGLLGNPVSKMLGDISYGVFAYHVGLLAIIEKAIGHRAFDGQFWELWLLTVSASVVAAWLSFRFVEKPIMRWGRRNEDQPATHAQAKAAMTAP